MKIIDTEVHLPQQVLRELKRDPVTSLPFTERSHPVPNLPGVVETSLLDDEVDLFVELISGPRIAGLGDGEAAAIAVAAKRNLALGIDERKARRLLDSRFPNIPLIRSTEILQSEVILNGLGHELAEECYLRAVHFGRMHVVRCPS